MTPGQHIARIREWRIGGGDIDLGDAVALCDAYEALAAERNKLQKDYGHLGDQLAYWKGLLDRRSTVLFARAEHAEARYEALAEAARRLALAVQESHLGAYDMPRHPGYPVDGCPLCSALLTFDSVVGP